MFKHCCSPAESVPHLAGQLLFTERIQGDKLLGQMFGTAEALGNKHDLTDELGVGHHHGTRSDAGDKSVNARLRFVILNEAQRPRPT